MKLKLINIIIIAICALAIGLAIGYFLFGNNSSSIAMDEHQHEATSEMTSASEEIWTCSMHPQVRMNEPGICPICEMDLIPLEANTSNDPLVLQMTEASTKLANIQTTIVGESQSGKDGKSFRLSGKIQADERMSSSLVSHVPGRIEKLYVTFTGEKVNKGQKIADLYSPELITAQRELLEAIKLQDVNSGLMDAARNKLRYWKISEETIDGIEKGGIIQETFPLIQLSQELLQIEEWR